MHDQATDQHTTLSNSNLDVQQIIPTSSAARPDRALHAARIIQLAEWLDPADRALLNSVYAHGKTMTEIAAMLRMRPQRIMRRVRALVKRIRSPEYAFVALHRHAWDLSLRRVATACVLQGRPTRRVAMETGMSLSAVRAKKAAAIAMARGARLAIHGGGGQWRGNGRSQTGSATRWRRSA